MIKACAQGRSNYEQSIFDQLLTKNTHVFKLFGKYTLSFSDNSGSIDVLLNLLLLLSFT